VRLTADVARAGELLGVELLDHLVIGGDGHVSLRQRGLYTPPRAR
jgi:DNA repair protein RadC